jgi:hypothetical protein
MEYKVKRENLVKLEKYLKSKNEHNRMGPSCKQYDRLGTGSGKQYDKLG